MEPDTLREIQDRDLVRSVVPAARHDHKKNRTRNKEKHPMKQEKHESQRGVSKNDEHQKYHEIS